MTVDKRASNFVADGYLLHIPPTAEQIDAVQHRMASYTSSNPPRPDKLDRLADRLYDFSDALYSKNTDDCARAAQTIRELADLAVNSAEDIRSC